MTRKTLGDGSLMGMWTEKQIAEQMRVKDDSELQGKNPILKQEELDFKNLKFELQKLKEERWMQLDSQKLMLENELLFFKCS